MPENQKTLRDHLEQMQHAAYVAESLVSVIVACGGNRRRSDLVIMAAEEAQKVLDEIGRGLDSVELDKVPA
jgi:Fe-S cluster assembly ATPase SufC